MSGVRRTKHVSRPLDYIYDPNFLVSHARDHQRAAMESFSRMAEFQICPKFSTMFSDSKNYSPACIKVKAIDKVPPSVDKSWKGVEHKSPVPVIDVSGSHRHLFYRRPNVSSLTPVAVEEEVQKQIEDQEISDVKSAKTDLEAPPRSRTFGIQTDYRESETQTVPYSPDAVIPNHSENPPMVLSLNTVNSLKWGQGLPPGLLEIENIEWEIDHRELKAFLLDPNNIPESKHPAALEYIHREEWLHREKEIQGIHDLRMDLAEKLMHKRGEQLSDRLQEIVKRKYEKKLEENWKKVTKIREIHRRELRKLINKQKGISTKYKRPDPITEQADYSSELYGPLMRHGVDPRRRHEVPLSLRSKFLHDYKGLGILEQATKWMKSPELVPIKEKPVDDALCTRGTRWCDEQLSLLQKYFKGLKSELEETKSKSLPKLMVPIPKPSPRPITPSIDGIPESEEKLYQAAVFMQKMIRGRAIQMLMFKGKERSQDLINELRTTQSVLNEGQNALYEEKNRTLLEYQDELEERRKEEAYENMLSMLVGDTIGAMLDFLAKELVRLKDERCIHALLLLAQRERHRREAEEAGRRQVEERRRREHDEVFKQDVKVHQETVDIYLEDIVLNAMEWVATAESRSYIKELAKNIDQKTKDLEDRKNILECKEIVTDIVYDIMLPEVYKEILDQDREKEQGQYVRTIQDEVYQTLDDPEREYQPDLTSESLEEENSVCDILDQEREEEREQYIQAIRDMVYQVLDNLEIEDQQPTALRTEEDILDQEREEEREQYIQAIRDMVYQVLDNLEIEDQQPPALRTEEERLDQDREKEQDQHLLTKRNEVYRMLDDPEREYQQPPDLTSEEEEQVDEVIEHALEEERSVCEILIQARQEEQVQYFITTQDEVNKMLDGPNREDQQPAAPRIEEEEQVVVVTEGVDRSAYEGKLPEASESLDADKSSLDQDGENM